jgi:hypothetical protein
VQGPVGPGSPEGDAPVTIPREGRGSSRATWREGSDRGLEDRWPSIGEWTRTRTGLCTKTAITPVNLNALANLVLHGIDQPNLWHGNTLTGGEVFGGLFEVDVVDVEGALTP